MVPAWGTDQASLQAHVAPDLQTGVWRGSEDGQAALPPAWLQAQGDTRGGGLEVQGAVLCV